MVGCLPQFLNFKEAKTGRYIYEFDGVRKGYKRLRYPSGQATNSFEARFATEWSKC